MRAVKACFVSFVLINLFGKIYLADSGCKPITDFYGGKATRFGLYYYFYTCNEGYRLEPADRDYSECNEKSRVWVPDPPKCLHINECDSEPCKNGGSCVDKVNGYTCTCQQGNTGVNCESDITVCVSGPCKNGGVCAESVNGYTCSCQKGYTGANCDTDINECSSAPCKNGGSCADKVNGHICSCQNGYTGINCETNINECASEPCKNGGSCADNVNGYTCTCQNGYTGINCETGVQCDPIGELYGGQAIYDSDTTEVGTSAYFECDDDFSMYPDVDNSLCLANRTWSPEPPKCYKKARAECPDNSDCHGSLLLHHNQTQTIRCDKDYELYDVDNKEFLDKKEIQITNIYGTLKPGVPSCVEKRCFSTTLSHAVIKYANGSHADLKVRSGGERLDLSCEDGYELDSERYRRLHKLSESVCCSKGKFYKNCKEDKEATQCIEKSCPFEGYPSNMRTKRQRAGEFSRFLADDEYIEHGETIEYSCQNEEYKLYVKETDEYLTEFSETCQYGNFSRSKQEFPLCQEQRCVFQHIPSVKYYTHDKENPESNGVFTVESRSRINITCNQGFKLFSKRTTTDSSQETATVGCIKGKLEEDITCLPEKLWQMIYTQVKVLFYRYDETMSKFACRFSLLSSQPCVDSCFVPEIQHGWMKLKFFSYTVRRDVNHETKVQVKCDEDYQLVGSEELQCINGEWNNELPVCWYKPCEIIFAQGQLVLNETRNITSTPGLQKTFEYGTKLHIKCVPGYSLFSQKNEPLEETGESVTSICQTGSWKPVYQCFQDCKLPDDDSLLYKTMYGDNVDPGSFIKHGTQLEVFCRYVDLGDFTFDDEADNYVPQVECSNGKLGQIDLRCKEEPCTIPYSYDNRLSIFIRRGGNVVSLFGGVTVNVGDTLFFNCANTEFDNYEPNNRRFKCKNGKWLEDEKDKDWKLGYDGEFPLCRNTSCVPMCINGGKCIRDDRCQCPHLRSGASCEIVLCDAECTKNGGTCIAPGKCGNCPPRAYGNNCEHRECTLSADDPKVKKEKSSYQLGDKILSSEISCSEGYIATPDIGITCLEGGNWSDKPKCISGCKPPVGIPEVKNNNKTFYHEGDKIDSSNLFCPRGHVLFPKDDIKCLNGGKWTETAKCQRGCFPPDGTPPLKTDIKVFYQTGEVIDTDNFRCPPGNFATPKDGMRCLVSGSWYSNITCIRGCTLPPDLPELRQQEKLVYVIGERITSSEFVCNFPSVLSSTNAMTCIEGGLWNETIKCGCGPPVHSPIRTQKQFYNTGETIASSEFVCDSSSMAIPEKGMTCMEGGHWTEPVNCIQDKAGCNLPFGDTFLYRSIKGDSINPGSFIRNGTKVKVYCQYIEPDYDYSVDMAEKETDTVQCLNGQLGNISLKCTTVPETCTTLANGSVKKRFMNEYEVLCNEGYVLNLMRPDKPYCECKEDKLVCQYGDQTPECKPVPCEIPETFDNGLKIHVQKEEGNISLSSGMHVGTGEIVIFSCTDVQYFEPNNRRFKCENGKWLEAETDQTWTLGNRGKFPKCRNTTCEPFCKNGGKCIRDDACECPHHTSGKRCENDLLDDCFKYIPRYYPFANGIKRLDSFFIGSGTSMNDTTCKLKCLNWTNKICKSVFHSTVRSEQGILQFYTCWGFQEDKRYRQFYKEYDMSYVRYSFRTCL